MQRELEHGAPEFRAVTRPILTEALQRGWQDFRRAPGLGLAFAAFYVIAGWIMTLITVWTETVSGWCWRPWASRFWGRLLPWASMKPHDVWKPGNL